MIKVWRQVVGRELWIKDRLLWMLDVTVGFMMEDGVLGTEE